MARAVTAITTLTAVVELAAPMHVGSAASAPGEPAAVLRDGAGRPILPGTTVAGVLRSVLEGGDDLELWGAVEQDADGRVPVEDLGASRVVVHDAVLELPDPRPRSGRNGVAIDRALGSATDALLYHRETLPAGARATLRVEVHSTASTETADRQLLADLRAALQEGALAFGARTSRGLGSVHLHSCTVTESRFDTPAGFWATRDGPVPVTLPEPTPGRALDVVDVTVDWAPAGPVFVGFGGLHSGRADDSVALPLMEPHPTRPELLCQVLPGTAIAGALRSRAELICRTLHPPRPDIPGEFDAQLASAPLAEALFGGPAGRRGTTASPLTVFDCASSTTVEAMRWLELVRPAPPMRVAASDGAELRLTTHVAVDRWTGGAADGLLFRVAEPHGFRFEPLRLRLDRRRLPGPVRDAATMLLLLTVRELAARRIPLGAGTHRGLGDLTVTRVRVRGAGLDLDGPDLDLTRCAALRDAWRTWISPNGGAAA